MKTLAFAAAVAATLAGPHSAAAQAYPSRPITINVPYAAGGPLDTVVRLLADPLRAVLGQAIVIENVAGAGGSIGVGRVTRAAPDGYTIGAGNWSSHMANGAIYALPYDLLKDLDPVEMLPSEPDLIIAKKSLPPDNLKDLIAWLKRNPDTALAGTSGIGGPSYMSAFFFRRETGTRFQLIPYRGSGPALLDLIAGHLDMMITGPAIALPQVRDGTIKVYAVTAKTRLATAPEIPTTDEAGLPGFYFAAWTGIWVPHGTPKEIVAKLSAAVREVLADPALHPRMEAMGLEVPPPQEQGAEALGALHRAEIEKWWPIIKAAGIKPE
jgi:tripartite-type tricarboxylate transporter receptor subunit TctC